MCACSEKTSFEQPKEVYHAFKEAFPSPKIGVSKFAELRPPHCVLAGESSTHSVCVCTVHQNVS